MKLAQNFQYRTNLIVLLCVFQRHGSTFSHIFIYLFILSGKQTKNLLLKMTHSRTLTLPFDIEFWEKKNKIPPP